MFAVVLTGPPGAGKSAVMTALADALSADDIPHAAIETEALVRTHPPLGGAHALRHIRTVCDLYRDAGYELLLVAQTLESDDEVVQLVDAVRADEHMLVRLEAEPATLVEPSPSASRRPRRAFPDSSRTPRSFLEPCQSSAGWTSSWARTVSTPKTSPPASGTRARPG